MEHRCPVFRWHSKIDVPGHASRDDLGDPETGYSPRRADRDAVGIADAEFCFYVPLPFEDARAIGPDRRQDHVSGLAEASSVRSIDRDERTRRVGDGVVV